MGRLQHIDVTTAVFARRFGAVLCGHRTKAKQYLWRLARHSEGRFTVDDLQEMEAGLRRLDEDTVFALVDLYVLSWDELLPPRVPLEISPLGTIAANGVEVPFDPRDDESLLASYLTLIRTLRDQLDRKVIEVRREDVEILCDHLQMGGSWVVTELATLMGANEREKRAMAAMYIAGANVISVSTPRRDEQPQRPEVVPLTRAPKPDGAPTPPPGPAGDEHPSRYHVVIPDRSDEPATVTVLADWHRDR